MDEEGVCLRRLFDDIKETENSSFAQTYLSLAARLLEMEPALADIYEAENDKKNSGFITILQEAKQIEIFNRDFKIIKTFIIQEQYTKLFQWIKKALENYEPNGKIKYLKEGILEIKEKELSKDLALAILYFSFHMLV